MRQEHGGIIKRYVQSKKSLVCLGEICPALPLVLSTLRTRGAIISPAGRRLLIASHAGAELNINPWRSLEAEALGHLIKIQLIDIEAGAEAVRSICLKIRPTTPSQHPIKTKLKGRKTHL